ncbi:hypothetical protein TNCV_5000181 [Trichonephila clavipes]|nr:hypothetical protein TNCV_5000181 [Trichonephila clavipes]
MVLKTTDSNRRTIYSFAMMNSEGLDLPHADQMALETATKYNMSLPGCRKGPKPLIKAYATGQGIFLQLDLPKLLSLGNYAKFHHYEVFGYKEQVDLIVPDSLWRNVGVIQKNLLPGLFLLRDIVNPGKFYFYVAVLTAKAENLHLSDTISVSFQGLMPSMPRRLTDLEQNMEFVNFSSSD